MIARHIQAFTLLAITVGVTAQSAPAACQVPGDPDILGLGIRLGLYFQFASNLFIGIVRPQEGLSSLLVSSMLACGIFVATIYSLVQNNIPPGAFITTQWFLLLDCQVILPILYNIERVDLEERMSFWTLSFILFRAIAWNGLNTWFWFRGLYIPNPQQCMEPRVWFYANFGAYGNIRKAFKAFTILSCVYLAWGLYRWGRSLVRRAFEEEGPYEERWKVKVSLGMGVVPIITPEDGERPEHMEPLKIGLGFTIYAYISGVFGLVVAIVAIELQLRWNNTSGINGIMTTGQIIPLVVGCVSLFRAIALTIIALFFR